VAGRAAAAVRKAGLSRWLTSHTIRRLSAMQVLVDGCDIRTTRQLLGLSDVRPTMVFTHVFYCGARGVRSPADTLPGPEIACDRVKQPITPRSPNDRRNPLTGNQL